MALAVDIANGAALAGRTCVGLVFAAAALDKMHHWRVLEGVIANYRLLPPTLVKPVALLLPPLELVLAAALLTGFASRLSSLAAIALLLLFAAAIAVNIRRGRSHIDCGCHQSFLRQTLRPGLVARNILLAALLLPALWAGAATPVLTAVGMVSGGMLFLIYLLFNLIAALPASAAKLELPA